ncbi:helix-turn-helix domain-containing protein [Dietzia cinnamea]|uniref:helix-turn-helix domain-containing protein n=1 Tax=Dietzia cinnamea TaxID=321318 RepID=UPI0021A2AD9D|nr:helix-turn-helix transcriptional regulator [Dietzia cinnamea]MCT1884975.1 helix-turn-helix domain-containing protein [Dietzia cinnamea]
MKSTPDLGRVVGANAKRIRTEHGVTMEAVSAASRDVGVRWTVQRVAGLEKGTRVPTVATLIELALVLARVTGTEVALGDLVTHDGYLHLTDALRVSGEATERVFRGGPVAFAPADFAPDITNHESDWSEIDWLRSVGYDGREQICQELGIEPADIRRVWELVDLATSLDQRTAKNLGVDLVRLAALSLRLWGRSISDERTARAEAQGVEGVNALGNVTKELVAELRQEAQR